jgi:hypothetical protein
MADDDKKKNGEKETGKEGGGETPPEVVPEVAEAAGLEGAEGESIGETEPEETEAASDSGDSDAGEPDPKPESRPAISLEILTRLSRGQSGQIHLHFRDRDVVVIADGAAAAEVFRLFANRRTPDAFAPSQTSWLSSWFSYEPTELLGITWYPMDLAPERRPVIDPVVPGLG